MAYVAQSEANQALAQNPNNLKAALAQFDKGFATLYVAIQGPGDGR